MPAAAAAAEAAVPEWATFNMDATQWYTVLTAEFGCDEASVMDLFCLAQHSSRGYEEANSIIAKLIKKRDYIRVPSAFVQTSVKNARHALSGFQ